METILNKYNSRLQSLQSPNYTKIYYIVTKISKLDEAYRKVISDPYTRQYIKDCLIGKLNVHYDIEKYMDTVANLVIHYERLLFKEEADRLNSIYHIIIRMSIEVKGPIKH